MTLKIVANVRKGVSANKRKFDNFTFSGQKAAISNKCKELAVL